mmetsp:Transcript_57680/g.126267  ORF Transcript_57680/g.126267 Transcript_57680/m.126267 type:complete len:193 (-) Transcript_57680:117-695(-)
MASQGAEGGASALSDMHAKWSEKGAHEFVPTNPQSFANKAPAMRPPRGPQNMGRMPPMAMQNPWAAANMNFMPEGQWNVQAQFAKGSAYSAVKRNFAAVWNLKADYRALELQMCLNNHDFYPECQEVDPGSFILIFEKTWQSAAFAISFDDSSDILKTAGGKAHTASFSNETGKWSKEDIPMKVHQKVLQLQ